MRYLIATLLLCLIASSADAKQRHHQRVASGHPPVILCDDRGCHGGQVVKTIRQRVQVAAHAPDRVSGHRRSAARYAAPEPAQAILAPPVQTSGIGRDRPRDCYGIQWCGCWLRHHFGMASTALNLAINWARQGSPASPESANVVVWRHHVGLLHQARGGMLYITSGNDAGAVRTRWISADALHGVVAYRRI